MSFVNPSQTPSTPTMGPGMHSANTQRRSIIAPEDNRISRTSFYTTGTDRTSRYETATSEEGFESAEDLGSGSDDENGVEEHVEAGWEFYSDNEEEDGDRDFGSGAGTGGGNFPISPSDNGVEIGGRGAAGEIRERAPSIASQATARYPAKSPVHNGPNQYQVRMADNRLGGVHDPNVHPASPLAGNEDQFAANNSNNRTIIKSAPGSSDGRDTRVRTNPSINSVTVTSHANAAALSRPNLSTGPIPLAGEAVPASSTLISTVSISASGSSQPSSTLPLITSATSKASSSISTPTSPPQNHTPPNHSTSRSSTSYTRGPNPPITTMTQSQSRHRRLSTSGSANDSNNANVNTSSGKFYLGNGNSSSSVGVGAISTATSTGTRRAGSSTNIAASGSTVVPNPNPNEAMASAPPTRSSTPPPTSSSFNITPAVPLPNTPATNSQAHGHASKKSITSPPVTRPSTGTTERETFSSPPIYTRSWSFYNNANATGVSGISTPRESMAFSRASSALALAAHVPGLAAMGSVSASETPGDETPETGYEIASNPFASNVDLKHEDDGGLRTKTYLLQGEIDKPWLKKRDWREPASWWITFCMILVGIGASAAVCWNRWNSVLLIKQPLCMVMQDDFDTFSVDHDGATWRREVDLSGFGNGEFEMTTNFDNNSFVKDGKLYIMPTLTSLAIGEANVLDGFTYNITGCTNTKNFEGTGCGAVSNKTAGTVINPVMSARLTTQQSHSIRYGRVDIRAKLPKGDWIWPALWMLPKENVYGDWPLSGEIDIMEARGNDLHYPRQGNNVVKGSLNWGPSVFLNSAWRTFGFWFDRRKSFADDFHVYTLEWTPEFIRMSVDSRLHKMFELRFNEPFFDRGQFPPVIQNGSQSIALQNPWFGRPNSAPFDQPFYLIMNVAVGGTSGWFPDNVADKPWLDNSATAMRDFALAQDKWYSTWPASPEDRAMIIDYVKMWELC